jgi:hypothetical protein
MLNSLKLLGFLVLFTLISACSDNPTNVTAEKMSLPQLVITPGYTWFNYELDNYQPDSFIINEIKATYNSSEHSFIIFAKPSCSCPGKHKQSPEFVKTLKQANIPIEKCEFYSMTSINNFHPLQESIVIKELPTIVVLKNGVPVFSVSDTLNNINNANPNNAIKVEQSLLFGLQK